MHFYNNKYHVLGFGYEIIFIQLFVCLLYYTENSNFFINKLSGLCVHMYQIHPAYSIVQKHWTYYSVQVLLNAHLSLNTHSTYFCSKKDWKLMSTSTFCCGKLYISEARNKLALESIERAAKQFPDAPIVNEFKDETYNRVGYTLVSLSSDSLKNAVFSMAKAAYEVIDLDLHTGNHPRLGVVDHICFHPLAATSLEQVATIARAIAKEVGSMLKGGLQSAVLPLEPDEGPAQVVKAKGVVVIGATKWVDNYNVPVFCTDISTVGRIARRVSGRGGGLASVQSLALVHDNNVIEVACKMLEPGEVGGEQVQGLVEQLGAQACVKVGKGYFTDLSPDAIVQTYFKLTSSS
ncbi:putative 5-formyltetrahydrofolate cyclo-ligase, Glutamate formimidoyltransferase [Helianthus annuus]|nr:putative 5-formyltetrahydrofolate cyclo-ligase, Glutamate formimidoyltransferase [Helianthus annuus]